MRQYGEIPAPNAAANTPAVSALTGAGTGGGASVQTSTTGSGNFGEVWIIAGPAADAGGSVVITFPDTPPALFISGSPDEFGDITQATDTNDVTISWTATLKASSLPHRIAYEWANYLKAN